MAAQSAVLADKPMETTRPGEAFNQLVQQETPHLLRLARRLLYDPEEARDLVQDTLLRAYLSLDSFRWECSLKTWSNFLKLNTRCTGHTT